MRLIRNLIFFSSTTLLLLSCGNESKTTAEGRQAKAPARLIEETASYAADSLTMQGFVAYSDSFEGKRPAVLVVHEWWGLNDYAKNRVRELARLGYVALAVDMFGNGQTADNPQQAMQLAGPFYENLPMAKRRFDAGLARLKAHPQVDTSKIAAIGYCFGGFIALNAAKQGTELDGVVSFHGSLGGVTPDKNLLKAKILVCHGAADGMVPEQEVAMFKKQMDSIGADYTFKAYPDSKHAFTNPNATEKGKKFNIDIAYNAEADKNSWNDMKDFFGKIFQ
ncbi:MAG TPA: dienelactone hydrolase family protein [Flavisolibacter sp.]|nr:dienelactone hydrolase family protein [Flavisolibacter sp.]